MFRDLYTKANDDIKGDRAILDRAFLQAAQPVKKKSPVIKYSFVGTAVAAAVVLGAVFANPSLFTDRSEDLGKLNAVEPTEAVVSTTEKADVLEVTQIDTPVINEALIDVPEPVKDVYVPKIKTVAPQKENVPPEVENSANKEAIEVDGNVDFTDDYGIAVMSLEGEDEIYEQPTDEPVSFTISRNNLEEELDDEWVEDESYTEAFSAGGSELSSEVEDGEEVEVFSYMYDMSCYGSIAVTEGFVNTDISPVTTADEAIMRAGNECTVDYDNTYVYCDSIEDMWKVVFTGDDLTQAEQIVYMNFNGVTTLIVYGE